MLGELGEYHTQAGYQIRPVIGIVAEGASMQANPAEVDRIYEIPLSDVFDINHYAVTWHSAERGHIACEVGGIRIAGPTLSILLGLYEHLAG